MGLMYAWATKDYLLWEMSIGQIMMYHNAGIEIKYPAPEGSGMKLSTAEYSQLAAVRDDMIETGLLEPNESDKKRWKEKYGEV